MTFKASRVPIGRACKALGIGYAIGRELVDRGLVRAWRFGGTYARPRLRVDPAELERAWLAHYRYVPPTPAAPPVVRRRSVTRVANYGRSGR